MRTFKVIFAVLLLTGLGCHRRPPKTALPPPSKPAVATIPNPTDLPPPAPNPNPPPNAPTTPPPPVVNPLEAADNAFNAEKYPEAAKLYENYLQRQPNGDRRDQALFRLALTCAVPSNPTPDWARMTTLLKQLVDQYPQSPLKGSAMAMLAIAADTQKRELQFKKLNTELEKLKQIDADRRRRP